MAKDSFFMPAGAHKKRKFEGQPAAGRRPENKTSMRLVDQEDDEGNCSLDELDLKHQYSDGNEDGILHAMEAESAHEKRLRLAKEYILQLEEQSRRRDHEIDAEEMDRDLIASRLQKDALEIQGRLRYQMAHKFPSQSDTKQLETHWIRLKSHRLSLTCAVLSPDGQFLYTASKDGCILETDLTTKQVTHNFPALTPPSEISKAETGNRKSSYRRAVLAMAVSPDGQYLVAGGMDRCIWVWNRASRLLVKTFSHHRDSISGLAFQQGTSTLYSASWDRTVKVFNMDQLTYVETLFGHQDSIMALCGMGIRDRCLTVGGRDRTVRLWKIPEESQLVFRATTTTDLEGSARRCRLDATVGEQLLSLDETGSVDQIAWIDDDFFVSGTDGGTLQLWTVQRKKPIFTVPNSHGRILNERSDDGGPCVAVHHLHHLNALDWDEVQVGRMTNSRPCWITAVAAVPNGDLIASGSSDGQIRFWQLVSKTSSNGTDLDPEDEEGTQAQPKSRQARLRYLSSIPSSGYVNALHFSACRRFLVAAMGQEPRLGRWERIPGARSGVLIIHLHTLLEEASDG